MSLSADDNTIRLSDSPRGIRAAAAMLGAGQLVAFPTETVYGLGADARASRAVAGIFAAKGRPRFNPLIVHVADQAAAEQLAEFSPQAKALAAAFWPGALTLVLPRRADSGLADLVTAGLDSVALRVPDHPLAQTLLRAFGGPIAAPSANPSGRISATLADHVIQGLGGRIAAVLDGGATGVGIESTIVGLTEGPACLLRPGGLPVDTIEQVLGSSLAAPEQGAVTAPGQLASHYAPQASLVLEATEGAPDALWLAFGPLAGRRGLSLSETGDLREAAARLFGHLHTLDEMAAQAGGAQILVDPVPNHGLGLAINDRLRRAAAPRG